MSVVLPLLYKNEQAGVQRKRVLFAFLPALFRVYKNVIS